MKSFASALLAAGAYAAAGAIDFSTEGTLSPFTLSLSATALAKVLQSDQDPVGTETGVQDSASFKWTLTTAHSAKQYLMTMEMFGANGSEFVAAKLPRMELFQCWKNGTQTTVGLTGMSCLSFVAAQTGSSTNNNLKFDVRLFKTVLSDAIVADTTWQPKDSDGTISFYTGASAGKGLADSGFGTTAVWTEWYHAEKAAAVTAKNSGPVSGLADAATATKGTVTAVTEFKAIPTVTVGQDGKSNVAFKFTVSCQLQAAASGTAGDFYSSGGLLYSQVLATFDQQNASAVGGISNKYDSAQTSFVRSGSPTLTTTLAEQVDGATTDSVVFTTNSGMALTAGTLSAANSNVNVFLVGASGDFMFTVKHTATLAAALTTDATVVQQMTCLDIETTITVKQYLCVLTDTNITANAASSTAILTQSVYSVDIDPLASNFTAATYFDTASHGLVKPAQQSSLMYQAKSTTTALVQRLLCK